MSCVVSMVKVSFILTFDFFFKVWSLVCSLVSDWSRVGVLALVFPWLRYVSKKD